MGFSTGDWVASWAAISAVSEALRVTLETARVGTPFPTASVDVFQTSDFVDKIPAVEGVSIYLHRVAINGAIRNQPPRVGSDGTRYRPSLPVDLHYLITPWAKSVSRQQELLGWIIRTLEDHPTLPTALLNKDGNRFREGEVVDIVAQALSSVELVAIWEFNKTIMQPSMTYVTRMVSLDSDFAFPDSVRVQGRGTTVGSR